MRTACFAWRGCSGAGHERAEAAVSPGAADPLTDDLRQALDAINAPD